MVGVDAGIIPCPSVLGGMVPGMPDILIDGCILPGTAPGRAWPCHPGGANIAALTPGGPTMGGACETVAAGAPNDGACIPGLGAPNCGGPPSCTCCDCPGGPRNGGLNPPVEAA